MHYDLTTLEKYLREDTHPSEVIQLLRYCRYALVCCSVYTEDYSGLYDRYLDLMMLEDQFLGLDEALAKLQIQWK